jgi:hypothetical protein
VLLPLCPSNAPGPVGRARRLTTESGISSTVRCSIGEVQRVCATTETPTMHPRTTVMSMFNSGVAVGQPRPAPTEKRPAARNISFRESGDEPSGHASDGNSPLPTETPHSPLRVFKVS